MTFISETTGKSPERQTRERILEAAIRVFSRKGYHDTRVDEIVDESQTSKGAVYFHFPSKEQIFLALVDEFAGLLEKKLLETIQSEGEGVRGVDAALRVGLETFAKYRSLAKIFLIQAVGLGAAFEEKRLQILDRLADVIRSYLDQAIAEGDIPPIDTRITAYAWIGAINEVVIRWVHTGEPSPEEIQPVLRSLLLRSIGVPEERIRSLS
jgi:AcrR family transcriptional regulator